LNSKYKLFYEIRLKKEKEAREIQKKKLEEEKALVAHVIKPKGGVSMVNNEFIGKILAN